MAKIKKPSIHAPWRKRNLIPLWCLQLGLAGYQFGWSLTMFAMEEVFWGSDYYYNEYSKASAFITMALGLVITAFIIVSIIKFSKFRLMSLDYQRDTVVMVALGVVSIVFVFSALDFFLGIFVALQVFFSIWLMVYAILVRKRVLQGQATEMKRPDGSAAKAQEDVELGSAGRVSTPREPPPSYHSPSREDSGQKTVVESPFATIRPSQISLGTDVEDDAPSKKAREFV